MLPPAREQRMKLSFPKVSWTFFKRCSLKCSKQTKGNLRGLSPAYFSNQEVGTGTILGSGEACDGLYILKGAEHTKENLADSKSAHVVASLDSSMDPVVLWHYRLGHPSFMYLERLFPDLFNKRSAKLFECEVCQLAKHTRTVYSGVGYQPTKPFAIVHSDIWGPMKVRNINGARWFITFIDDHTRLTWTFLMKDKSETTGIFQDFHTMIRTQFRANIQVLKTDNAHDYFNHNMSKYLNHHGIIHASSCVDTPQQNGIAERKNRHLLEVARASMFAHHIPKHLWGEAVLTATYLINRLPSSVLQFQTPRQLLLQCFPHIASFTSDLPPKVFGCTVFIHVAPQNSSKLDPRSVKGVLIGYSASQKGYKCYVPSTRKVYNTMDVTFFESQSYYKPTVIQGEHIADYSTECESQQFVDLISVESEFNTSAETQEVQGEHSSSAEQVE
ncbi:Retrovirus-related Pol polyprotein from transposon TNT 1-94, partial [Linum grandiflorum]